MEATNEAVKKRPNRGKPEKNDSARASILLAILLTVANIVLLFVGGNYFFLFSAEIPYFAVLMGQEFSYMGDLPGEAVCYIIAVAFLALLVLCWQRSEKRPGWLVAAAVLFVLDTAVLLWQYESDAGGILDYVFHAWILFDLIRGAHAAFKRKKQAGLYPEPGTEEAAQDAQEEEEATEPHDRPLYMADMEGKQRVFLECEAGGLHILYRRVKHTNELVVNGRVYDTIEGIVEFPHTLYAQVNGHQIEASFEASNHTYIRMDGEVLGKKLRLW